MYCCTISSVRVPELTARYPRAQKCRPQNCFRRWGNSWSSTRELIPFNHCTMVLMNVTRSHGNCLPQSRLSVRGERSCEDRFPQRIRDKPVPSQ